MSRRAFEGGGLGSLVQGLQDLRAICSAPGKVILFGEHAVVYGHPAIAAATNQRTSVEVDVVGDRTTVNGYRIHERYHSYLLAAVERCWHRDEPVRLQTEGGVPSASGTGSSAALTVAAVRALHQLQGIDDLPRLAQEAFGVERATQGGGSPVDTSTSTAGGAIAIAGKSPGVGEKLWQLQWETQTWDVERITLPEMTVVVGNSGVKGKTDEQVAKVAGAAKKNVIIRETLGEIGQFARDAVPLLAKEDWSGIGELMNRAHSAMHTLGVNHPAVQKLVDVSRATPGTMGAKITGAGGGGSMVAITDKPRRLQKALEAAGATAYVLTLGGPGVQTEASLQAPDDG